MGGSGSFGTGLGRYVGGGRSHRFVADDYSRRHRGTATTDRGFVARAPPGRRSQTVDGRRSGIAEPPLESLVEPTERGEPESPLRWTIRSARVLAETLTKQGHPVSHSTVASLLREAGFSLQANRKTREGSSHPDRDAQFTYLNEQVVRFQRRHQPAVSVDTKKKELVGDFKNGGREYRRRGRPQKVRVHDFKDEELGKAIPYGVYDLQNNEGWVSVGIGHDTAEFAANTIHSWWAASGFRMPKNCSSQLTVAAAIRPARDCGRSPSRNLPIERD